MTEVPPLDSSSSNADRRSRSLRALLLASVMTPLLVLPEPVRTIVSVEATVLAIASGVIAGAVLGVAAGRIELGTGNDARTTLVALASSVSLTVALWILLPADLFQTAPQFGLAVLWSFAIVSVGRDVVGTDGLDVVRP